MFLFSRFSFVEPMDSGREKNARNYSCVKSMGSGKTKEVAHTHNLPDPKQLEINWFDKFKLRGGLVDYYQTN
jgi:hypothetical protein